MDIKQHLSVIRSEEVVVRDFLVAFVREKFSYEVQRTSFSLRSGVVYIRLPALLRRAVLRNEEYVVSELQKLRVEVFRLV